MNWNYEAVDHSTFGSCMLYIETYTLSILFIFILEKYKSIKIHDFSAGVS